MILFTEYFKMHGRRETAARHLLAVGRFETATKIDGKWHIDEAEPYPAARDFVNFDRAKRIMLETYLRKGFSKAECARRLGFNRSSVTREIKRGEYEHTNSDLTTETRYSCDKAQADYELACTALGPPLKLGKDKKLAAHIETELTQNKRSPDSILGRIKEQGLKFDVNICTTTLYKYISDGVFLNVTNADLPEQGKQRKRPYRKVVAKRPPAGDSIENRPQEANDRSEAGHWEMDSIKGKQGTKETDLVLTERMSRAQKIVPMPDGTSASVIAALDEIERKLGALFPIIFKTITSDNGPENLDYNGIERSITGGTRTKMYYCHPYSSFERGSNENQNRHIRRFIPKGTPLIDYSAEQTANVEEWLNTNPRRMFSYRTSEEVFNAEFAAVGATISAF